MRSRSVMLWSILSSLGRLKLPRLGSIALPGATVAAGFAVAMVVVVVAAAAMAVAVATGAIVLAELLVWTLFATLESFSSPSVRILLLDEREGRRPDGLGTEGTMSDHDHPSPYTLHGAHYFEDRGTGAHVHEKQYGG